MRYLRIDLKKLAEASFSSEELSTLATEGYDGLGKVDWTSSVIEGLEETKGLESALMTFIMDNYRS